MEARAVLRYAKVSPTKARQVLRVIQGMKAGDALYQLRFVPKKSARIVEGVLRSALANAEQKGMDLDKLYIKKAVADEGPMYKKWLPRAHGRATPMRKRASHITILLEEREED
ncbi:MAG: 50S ribosomal protein L22 [Aquificaceae bacterium]|nr:50S ribosomal protein L22 [Aquificaceae bacterium]MDW8433433.1 50S ribosomal protein L22 [Aquificaceae bacterium]